MTTTAPAITLRPWHGDDVATVDGLFVGGMTSTDPQQAGQTTGRCTMDSPDRINGNESF
jgi:hypothetical protein